MNALSDEEHLLAPFCYVRKITGKQVRGRMASAFNVWLKIDVQVVEEIKAIVEMLHDASLMIDDVEDNSVLRRGVPVTHNVFGVPRTINSANYVCWSALSRCLNLRSFEAVNVFTSQMLELHRGQGKELYWRDTVQCPSEEEYETMVVQKTGGLFLLTLRLMALFSEVQLNLTSLVHKLAMYFQIRDDYLNLCSATLSKQKSFAEDLTEGKFSFPIIAAIKNTSSDDEILNILRLRSQNVDVKKYVIEQLHQRGALRYTLDRLKKLYDDILQEIQSLGGNSLLISLVDELNRVLVQDECDMRNGAASSASTSKGSTLRTT
ncbi:hypothetical protein AB6A40_000064 [Gnathostoma spinigerum]|uniref:Geranylgeranyl pyrophosphate synthase n=1 Tax=Gnathostoma spinigerum TaxID=75299 RepID=A0ABD6E1B6_9BILA